MDMENQQPDTEKGLFDPEQGGQQDAPFVIFKVKENTYCIDSRYIETLLQVPEFVTLPDSPDTIKGVFPYRGNFITMYDLRAAFGQESMADEFNQFASMLDQRKSEHVRWVEGLEQAALTGKEFTLSHDPHACAFGRWYDHFQSDNYLINTQLKKIDEPHKKLHHSADELDECRQIEDPEEREKRLKEIVRQVKDVLMPTVLNLLDETKEVFRSTMYHEMALILRDTKLSLIADEVQMVDYLQPAREEDSLSVMHKSPYLLGIRRSQKHAAILLELNVPRILQEAGV